MNGLLPIHHHFSYPVSDKKWESAKNQDNNYEMVFKYMTVLKLDPLWTQSTNATSNEI